MTLRMLVDGLHEEETRMVIADDDQLIEFDIETSSKKQNKGNIYLAKVTRVEPSLQAAFVEYGSGRQGFLPFSEIHPDYYQIPVADKHDLLRAQAEQREAENRKVEEEIERASRRREERNQQAHGAEGSESSQDEISHEQNDHDHEQEHHHEHDNQPDHDHYKTNETGITEDVAVSEPVEIEQPSGEETSITEQMLPLPGETETPANIEEVVRADHQEVVEDLGSDEPFEERPKRQSIRRYKIQEVVKKNQIVLIQVIKEERGNKGASVTTYISLPGRYCVLMPNTNRGGGVSRKISDVKERRKLKETIEGLELKDGMSLIVRTAGMGRTKADITRDYTYLIKLWNKIREDTLSSSAPALVHEEGNVIKRGLRDHYNNDVKEVIISGTKAFETAREFMKLIMPTHGKKIELHEDAVPIFNKYGIEQQLQTMNDPVVTLNSGGYIVINPTEALISIDVNSGRATGERNVEDTATRTNIDAAWEIARQLRLRDLAGLIVIDFIDMLDSRHRRQVERTLKDALKSDRAKIQVGRISPFGLLEMSRQRLRPSITEINMIECPSCKGIGHIRSADSAMVQLARSIENELAVAKSEGQKIVKVIVSASASLALYFLNNKRKRISELEEQYGFDMVVEVADISPSSFRIQLEDENGGKSRVISSDDRDNAKLPQSRGDGRNNRRGGRGGRNDRRDRRGNDRNRGGREQDNEGESQEHEMEISTLEGEGGETNPQVGDDSNEPREIGEDGEFRPRNNRNRNRRRGRGRNRNRNRGEGFSNDRPPREDVAAAPSDVMEEVITHGSFAPSNPRPPRREFNRDRQQQQPRVDSGEESPSGYREKEVRELREPAHEQQSQGGDSESSGNRKGGWWRKMIE